MAKKVQELTAPTADPPPPATDRFLRRFGFSIASRWPGHEPQWLDRRTHRIVAESLAYKIACERMRGGTA